MGLNAKYSADFDDFYAAVQKANLSLADWEKSGDAVERQMNDVADSLSGAKVIQDATLMAAAIEKLGGTSGLTAKELAKVGSTAKEATDKLKAMGKDVPQDIQNLADEAGDLPPLFAEIGKAALAMFTVDAVLSFTKEIVTLGGEINNLATTTGLTTTEVQQLMAVAEAAGVPFDALAGAAKTLSERLGSEDRTGVNSALTRLNISIADFDGQTLYAQMLQVSEALKGVESDAERNAIGAELFGGKWKTVGAAIQSDMKGVADGSITMSAEALYGIEQISGGMSKLGNITKTVGGEIIGALGNFFAGSEFGPKAQEFQDRVSNLTEAIKRIPPAWDLAARASQDAGVSQIELDAILKESNATLTESIKVNKELNDAQAELASSGRTWQDTVQGMNQAQVESIKAGLEAGISQKSLVVLYDATATQVKAVAEALRAEERAIEATNRLWREYNEIVTSQTGTSTDVAIANVERWAAEVARQMEMAGAATTEFYDALAETTHARMNDILIDWEDLGNNSQALYARNLEQIAQRAEATFAYATDHAEQFSVATIQRFGETAQAARDAANNWRESWVEAGDVSLEAVEKTTQAAKASFESIERLTSKNAPGSVAVNLGDMTFGPGGLEAAMKAYTARYSASSIGAIGGGPAGDFLSFAKGMGYAMPTFPQTGGGAVISNTFNVVDTEAEIARRVADEISRQIQRGSLVQ